MYDARARLRTKIIAGLLRRSGVLQNARVLDLGVGTGLVWEHVGQPSGSSVVGVDRSLAMLARARSRSGARIRVVQADFEQLPFSGRSFDVLVMTFSAHHVRDLAKTLHRASKVLHQNGRLVLIDYSGETQLQVAGMVMRCYALLRADPEAVHVARSAPPPFVPCSEEHLIAAAYEAGFTVSERRYEEALEAETPRQAVAFVMNSPPIVFDLIRCPRHMRDAIRNQLLRDCQNRRLACRVRSRILFCIMHRTRRE